LLLELEKDSFASGQIGSKLWLCRELEKTLPSTTPLTYWVLGGWIGMLPFLIRSREVLPVKSIRSFDLDGVASEKAEIINNLWVWQEWQFKSFRADCNELDFNDGGPFYSDAPDVIINTSTEHMPNQKWFENIPEGRWVVLQNTDMKIDDHVNKVTSVEQLKEKFPLSQTHYSGELYFDYGNETSFKRFMLIGQK